MAELAQLSISVDSTAVQGASADLDRLSSSAGTAETATGQLSAGLQDTASAQLLMRTNTRLSTKEIETAVAGTQAFEAEQDKFYASLKRSADMLGMSKSQMMAYKASLLELGDNSAIQGYIAKLKAAEDAQAAMSASGAGLSDMFERQLLRTTLRAGASFAVMTVGIQGTISLVEMLAGASDHLSQSLTGMALAEAKGGLSATQLMDQMQKESEAMKLMGSNTSEAATAQQQLKSMKEQVSALGPEYYAIMNNENLSLKEQVALIAELNQKTKEKLQEQIFELTMKGPEDTVITQMERGASRLLALYAKFTGDGLAGAAGNAFQNESDAKANDAITKWNAQLTELRTNVAKLDAPSAFTSELDKMNAKLLEQYNALGKTAGQLVYEKEIELGATEAVAQEAKARQDAIDAATKHGRAIKTVTETLMEQLEKEEQAYGQIKSENLAGQLAVQWDNLTASQKEHVAWVVQDTLAAQAQAEAQKQLSKQFEDDDKIAKERDDIENKLIMTHEKYLATLREKVDPSWSAGTDFQKQMDGLNELNGRGLLSTNAYDLAVIKIKDDYVRLKAEGSPALQALVDLTDTASQQMGKAFGDFVTTGKLDFKSLVDSILADFARMEAQKGTTQFFNWVMSLYPTGGSGSGQAVSGTGGASSYTGGEDGGFTGQGFGDYSDGIASGPIPSSGQSVQQSNQITITVHTHENGQATTSTADGSGTSGKDVAQKLRGLVVQTLIEEQRPGGALNRKA